MKDFQDVIINSQFLNSNLEKVDHENFTVPEPNCHDHKLYCKIIKILLDLISITSAKIDKCKLVRYLTWFMIINYEHFKNHPNYIENALNKWVEFYQNDGIEIASKWIQIMSDYKIKANSANSANSLIDWNLNISDNSFGDFWNDPDNLSNKLHKINLYEIENIVHYLLKLVKSEDNQIIHERSFKYLNSIIKNCSEYAKLLFIGNNSCIIRIANRHFSSNSVLYCPYYQEIVDSPIIEEVNINFLSANNYGTGNVIYYLVNGVLNYLNKNEMEIENKSISDRVEHYLSDSINKHFKIESLKLSKYQHCYTNFNINANLLFEFLKITNGVLSGGFAIRIALDDESFGKDIDIFIPTTIEEYKNIDQKFYKNFFPSVEMVPSDLIDSDYPNLERIISIWNPEKIHSFPFQFIFINIDSIVGNSPTDKIINYINNYFDLTICTSCISSIGFHYPTGNIDFLNNRESTLKLPELWDGEDSKIIQNADSRFIKYEKLNVSIKLNDICSFCLDKNKIIDYKLKCGHGFHKKCIYGHVKYSNCSKYDKNKHLCPVCHDNTLPNVIKLICPITDHLSEDQLAKYLFCSQCHQFRSPELFKNQYSSCQYCLDNSQLFKLLNISNCPNCGLEIEYTGGCNNMVCCIYGGDCKGSQYCNHGSSNLVNFCGNKWTFDKTKQ